VAPLGPAAPPIGAPPVTPPRPPPPAISRPAPPPIPRPAPPRRGWAGFAFVVLVVLLVSIAVAAILARGEIVTAWPQAARLFALVGLAPR
jgi:hypothetical protein